MVVIADGAAFGAEINDFVEQQKLRPRKLALFLPESFEWIVLKSGVIQGIEPSRIEQPELYADSAKFMSWEQYFTELLINETKGIDYLRYKKSKLAEFYLQEKTAEMIRKEIKGIQFGAS